jgi:hypothetical protein
MLALGNIPSFKLLLLNSLKRLKLKANKKIWKFFKCYCVTFPRCFVLKSNSSVPYQISFLSD